MQLFQRWRERRLSRSDRLQSLNDKARKREGINEKSPHTIEITEETNGCKRQAVWPIKTESTRRTIRTKRLESQGGQAPADGSHIGPECRGDASLSAAVPPPPSEGKSSSKTLIPLSGVVPRGPGLHRSVHSDLLTRTRTQPDTPRIWPPRHAANTACESYSVNFPPLDVIERIE